MLSPESLAAKSRWIDWLEFTTEAIEGNEEEFCGAQTTCLECVTGASAVFLRDAVNDSAFSVARRLGEVARRRGGRSPLRESRPFNSAVSLSQDQ